MGHCNGNCGGCSGCGRELELTKPEVDFLRELAQIPFMPLVREMGEDVPILPGRERPETSRMLQCLEKKGLISLDYEKPLQGYDYSDYPIRGSLALTARGQQVLELLEYQGIRC